MSGPVRRSWHAKSLSVRNRAVRGTPAIPPRVSYGRCVGCVIGRGLEKERLLMVAEGVQQTDEVNQSHQARVRTAR
jgi:hypothetical protein